MSKFEIRVGKEADEVLLLKNGKFFTFRLSEIGFMMVLSMDAFIKSMQECKFEITDKDKDQEALAKRFEHYEVLYSEN